MEGPLEVLGNVIHSVTNGYGLGLGKLGWMTASSTRCPLQGIHYPLACLPFNVRLCPSMRTAAIEK